MLADRLEALFANTIRYPKGDKRGGKFAPKGAMNEPANPPSPTDTMHQITERVNAALRAPSLPWRRKAAGWEPPHAWPGAKSVADAETQVRHDFPHLKVDFGGLPLPVVNAMMPHFYALSSAHPAVAGKLQYLGTLATKSPDLPYGDIFDAPSSIHHFDVALASDRGNFLVLNPKYFGDRRLARMSANSVASGYRPPGYQHPAGDLVHEFGHLVQYHLQDRSKAFGKALKENYDQSAAHGQVSDYGRVSPGEAWAEGFMLRHFNPVAAWPEYVTRQDAILKKWKGKT